MKLVSIDKVTEIILLYIRKKSIHDLRIYHNFFQYIVN